MLKAQLLNEREEENVAAEHKELSTRQIEQIAWKSWQIVSQYLMEDSRHKLGKLALICDVKRYLEFADVEMCDVACNRHF